MMCVQLCIRSLQTHGVDRLISGISLALQLVSTALLLLQIGEASANKLDLMQPAVAHDDQRRR